MTADEPSIFENLNQYMKTRLMMVSAVVFRRSSWDEWTYGHEKLLGVILWHYEAKKENRFKYSKVLKRYAYGRTQNYKLLKGILDQNILVKQGNGYYTFPEEYKSLIDKALEVLKTVDRLGNPKEGE
jgi:hypothetical protein